jgi:hypothetical protein
MKIRRKKAGSMHWGVKAAVVCLLASPALRAQSSTAARQAVDTMLAHENDAAEHRNKYMYISEERSERTGGHLWKELVVETEAGKLRLLIAENGQPLSGRQLKAEKARLAEIAAHPDELQRRDQAMKNDEQHAEQMLALLHKAFLFEEPRVEGGDLRIAYRPDPTYQPQTLEEKVLHAMSGSVLIDERTMQLHRIEGKVPADVSLGYGLLGTIHAGSSFSTAHEMEPGNEWKPSKVDTEIDGKAIFFKAIGRSQHAVNSDFKLLPHDISVPQAVEILEK